MSHYLKRLFCFLVCLLGQTLLCAEINQEPSEWESYYQSILHISEPHPTLSLALKYFQREGKEVGKVLDLGAGPGRDALYLLKKGWRVHAYDSEQLALDILLSRVSEEHLDRLSVTRGMFSEMVLPRKYDLINASLSLPFCPSKDFPRCWETIVEHIAVGGRFSGHFFGDRDELAVDKTKTFLSQEQVLALFSDRFKIEYLQVEEGLKPLTDGTFQYWHVFHVIARKLK